MGNVHRKHSAGQSEEHSDDSGHYQRPVSPPASPGSPLTYSPQVAMEPIAHDEFPTTAGASKGGMAAEFHGLSGYPAQPKLVPTVIVWTHGGSHVEVEGSFDNWGQRHTMQRSGKDHTIVKLLPPGVYQYKFIVDGEWKYAPDQPAMYDDQRNVNNVLEVQEYVPENLDSLSGFEPPPSPPESYADPLPEPADYQREPPALPPHLQLTLLNVPPAMDVAASLPRPQHVVLNHLYCRRSAESVNAMVVGTTHRYKSKYVTVVMYKPKPRPKHQRNSQQQQQQQAAAAAAGFANPFSQQQAAAAAAAAQQQAAAAQQPQPMQ